MNIYKKFKDRNRKHEEIFASAEALGVVTESGTNGYSFKNLPLGLTREEVVETLKKDGNVTTSIMTEIEKLDKTIEVVSSTREIPEKKPAAGGGKKEE